MTIAEPAVAGDLRTRFAEVFASIAEGAAARERDRVLPFEQVEQLRTLGFGALRVPVELGGAGASVHDLAELLIGLGAADSNLPQLLRGHFAFLEGRLAEPDRAAQERWLRLAVDGRFFGNAQAERGAETGSGTRLEDTGHGFTLSGTKYYSTGTLFADWIWSTAQLDDEHVGVALSTGAPGVERLDDWDGFGQRLTGSGTTHFRSVPIPEEQVIRFDSDGGHDSAHAAVTAFYQLVLLATLAGIAQRALSDVVEFVRPRTRTFGVPGASSPRTDPLVQSVVGRVSSQAAAVRTLVLGVADRLDELHALRDLGAAEAEDYVDTEIAAFQAQQVVIPLVLDTVTRVFEVGGASATSETLRLDRHWRNARTVSSHNPLIQRERAIGDWELNGTAPGGWRDAERKRTAEKLADTEETAR